MFVSKKRYRELEERVQELELDAVNMRRKQQYQADDYEPERVGPGFIWYDDTISLREVVKAIVDHLGMRVKKKPPLGPSANLVPDDAPEKR